MKEKIRMLGYIITILVLSHFILIAGCGKNPLIDAVIGNISMKVVKL